MASAYEPGARRPPWARRRASSADRSRRPNAAAAAFSRRDLSADEARRLAHGGRLAAQAAQATQATQAPGPTAAFAPDGTLIALLTEQGGQARPLVVFAGS